MLAFCLCGYRLMAKLTAFQAVAMGSSPITRTLLDLGSSGKGGVTQLVRVLACHARSRGFESHHSRAYIESSVRLARSGHRLFTATTRVQIPYGIFFLK